MANKKNIAANLLSIRPAVKRLFVKRAIGTLDNV
jgi:hypothetical protein